MGSFGQFWAGSASGWSAEPVRHVWTLRGRHDGRIDLRRQVTCEAGRTSFRCRATYGVNELAGLWEVGRKRDGNLDILPCLMRGEQYGYRMAV